MRSRPRRRGRSGGGFLPAAAERALVGLTPRLRVVALDPAAHALNQLRVRISNVDRPGRSVRWRVGLGRLAEAAAVLVDPARPVVLIVAVGFLLDLELFLQASLG